MRGFSLFIACAIQLTTTVDTVEAQTLRQAVVRGVVTDDQGEPRFMVNVQIIGTLDGAITDREGRFKFSTKQTGPCEIRATMIGYEPAIRSVSISAGDTVNVQLVLTETLIELETVIVTASAYTTGGKETVTLNSLEVVTTPGAAADIFLAIKTFPGVSMVDEGAGLFVRGGDVSETVILLDQATLVHPYRFESPTGGAFGTIPPFLISGTMFSTGGFSARYGSALSAVLTMDSQNMPLQPNYNLNLGLAAASAGLSLPIIPDKLGLRFSGNRSFTDIMFRLNGRRDEFTLPPRGADGNLSLIYQYSPTGRIKLFNFMTTDRLGVYVDEPSFTGVFHSQTTARLHNLQWTELRGDWLIQTSASLNHYGAHRQLGNLDLKPADRTFKLRTDVEGELSEMFRILFGGEVERTTNIFRGTIPAREDVLNPDAETTYLDEHYTATRTGGYSEIELKPTRRITASLGIRSDYYSLAGSATVDPRLIIMYRLSAHTDLRIATGVYHRFPSPYKYNPNSGNPELGPQRSIHYIVGLNYEHNYLTLRLEAYYKPYNRLVLRHSGSNYRNAGDGAARGIDLFIKYGEFLLTRINGWLSYSFLQSDRLQTRQLADRIVYEQGPSPFDITHNLTLVTKMRLVNYLSGGFTFRYATGRPVTPVVGSIPTAGGSYYLPIEGLPGSERLPDFTRLDTDFSYFLPFGNNSSAIFYLGISNLLNRSNVLDYEYSADYSERRKRRTNYSRFIYFGLTVNLAG